MANLPEDGKLLAHFARAGDEAPFQELLRRHGGMVFQVCQRVLGNLPDAEDAAQAVFLTLAQKSKDVALQRAISLGGWLHRLAWHVAMRLRRAAEVRRKHEQEAMAMNPSGANVSETSNENWEKLRPLLDEELAKLPEKYRLPFVLCLLEGHSQESAAELLSTPKSTVGDRVERARQMLRKRLAHKGVVLSVATLAALITASASAAELPVVLFDATAKAASLVLAGNLAATGMVSGQTAALMQQAAKMLWWAKLKAAGIVLIVAGLIAVGGVTSYLALAREIPAKIPPPQAEEPATPAETPMKKATRPAAITITPHGDQSWRAFDALSRKGLKVVILGGWQNRRLLQVPVEMRFKPVDGRELVQSVTATTNLKVAWTRGGNCAVLYTAVGDAALSRLRNDLESTDVPLRREAAWRGGWLRDIRVVPLLIKAVKDSDTEVAHQAVVALRHLSWDAVAALDDGALELVAGELQSPLADIRAEAADSLGHIGGHNVLPLLEKASADQDAGVRDRAAAALGTIGNDLFPGSTEKALTLLEKAQADENAVVRQSAAWALAGISVEPGAENAERVRAALEKARADPDIDVRSAAGAALNRIAGKKDLDWAEDALNDMDRDVRGDAASALGSVGGEKALALLEKALADRDAQVRWYAAIAVGHFGNAKALALLEKAFSDKDAQVRWGSVGGLMGIGGDKTVAMLEKALADDSALVRRGAGQVLAQLGGENVLAPLKKVLADPNALVRRGAAGMLRRVGVEKAFELLQETLSDKDAAVRRTCVASLGSAGGELDGDQVMALLEMSLADPDPGVRSAAIRALGYVDGPAACADLLGALKTEKDAEVLRNIALALRQRFTVVPAVKEALKNMPLLPEEHSKTAQHKNGPDAEF